MYTGKKLKQMWGEIQEQDKGSSLNHNQSQGWEDRTAPTK